jgi:hypothetical protein
MAAEPGLTGWRSADLSGREAERRHQGGVVEGGDAGDARAREGEDVDAVRGVPAVAMTVLPGASGARSAAPVQAKTCRVSTCQLRLKVSQVCSWTGAMCGTAPALRTSTVGRCPATTSRASASSVASPAKAAATARPNPRPAPVTTTVGEESDMAQLRGADRIGPHQDRAPPVNPSPFEVSCDTPGHRAVIAGEKGTPNCAANRPEIVTARK